MKIKLAKLHSLPQSAKKEVSRLILDLNPGCAESFDAV